MKHAYIRHLITLIVLGLLAGGSLAGLLFFGRSVEAKVQKTEAMTAKLALYDRNRALYDAQSKLVKDLEARTSALSAYLVTSETVPQLLSKLEDIAKARNLSFEIQNVQTPVDKNKQKELLVTFKAQGSKAVVEAYFDDLSREPFLTHITNFSFATYEGEGDNTTSTDWVGIATIEIQSFVEN